jgi:hypothetical protein
MERLIDSRQLRARVQRIVRFPRRAMPVVERFGHIPHTIGQRGMGLVI